MSKVGTEPGCSWAGSNRQPTRTQPERNRLREPLGGLGRTGSEPRQNTHRSPRLRVESDKTMEPVQFVPHGGGGAMSHDGDARSLEAEAAVATLSARELREAAASLAARSDADEDSLGRPAPVFNADDIQHLQTLAALDPFILDKVITDGNVQAEEPANASTTSHSHQAMSLEDRIMEFSRYIAMQKELYSASRIALPSEKVLKETRPQSTTEKEVGGSKKRKRSTTRIGCVDPSTPNTVHLGIQIIASPTQASPVQKKSKRSCSRKSHVWKHFDTGKRGQDPIATCKYCGQVYACDRSVHGTGTLWKHLRHYCPTDPLKGKEFQRKDHGTPKQSFSIEECRQALAAMVIIDEMPFRTVEGVGFKLYSKVLQPRFEVPSRITVARDCMQRYVEEKPKLKRILRNHRMCLTTDTWTSNQNFSYMTLTAHWIDDEWKLQKRIINFCSVPDHKGETLGKRVEECLLEWGIDRVFTITVDNASSNDKLIEYLKGVSKDWDGIVLQNRFLHVRCCAHIVNLVVKSGLEEHNESVDKIRTAVRFVRSSPSRLKLFKKCVEMEKISNKSLLSLDVETRWNSTYLMLESAEKFEKAFARLAKEHKPFRSYFVEKLPPDEYDWRTARRILCFLKLFYKVTTRISASLHVTSSIVFHDIMLMHTKLIELTEGNDQTLSSMAYLMKVKFEKYWKHEGNLNYLLFIAVILDPRYKLKYLSFYLKRLYGLEDGKELIDKIQLALNELFGFYVETVAAYSSRNKGPNQAPIHVTVEEDDEENPWNLLASQFDQHLEEIENETTDSELSRYLADNCEKRTKEFDILNYWKVNSNKYPALSRLAKDVLAVPASTVPSESAFSTGGRIIDPLRSSLSCNMVEALICSQSWLHSSASLVNIREIAEEVQTYEEIGEEIMSKDCIESQHQYHIDLTGLEA